MSAPSLPVRALALVLAGSAAVLAGALLFSFRLPFPAELATVLNANGARVLVGAAAGAALGLAASLQLARGALRPLMDLQVAVAAAMAAAGGLLAAWGRFGRVGLALFLAGAAVAGALGWWLVGRLDRSKRWTNVAAAALLVLVLLLAAGAGSYGRARSDAVVPVALWLLGDLGRVDGIAGIGLLLLSLALLMGAALSRPSSWETLALMALGLGIGATGPLPFAATFAARAVHRLMGPRPGEGAGAPPALLFVGSAVAGAAAVVAVDAVPRLLIGGYALPFLVPACMLALPVFLGWNRARLRALAGRGFWVFEVAEAALILLLTAIAAAYAVQLTRVIHQLT
jgi:hypothetical protein